MCEGFYTLVSFITAVCGLYTQLPELQRMKLKCLAIRVMTAASIYIPSEERMFSRTCMLCLQVISCHKSTEGSGLGAEISHAHLTTSKILATSCIYMYMYVVLTSRLHVEVCIQYCPCS